MIQPLLVVVKGGVLHLSTYPKVVARVRVIGFSTGRVWKIGDPGTDERTRTTTTTTTRTITGSERNRLGPAAWQSAGLRTNERSCAIAWPASRNPGSRIS